jgi:hypothetical protein
MPVTGISWDVPDDIHLLRGKSSRRLDQILKISHAGAITNPPSPPPSPGPIIIPSEFHASDTTVLANDGIAVTFQAPPFKSTATPGFTIDATTGVVTALTPTPTTRPRNFIVKAILTKTGSTTPFVPPLPIRIHIHETIVSVHLTPESLTARKKDTPPVPGGPGVPALGDTTVAFSVFAEFFAGGVDPNNKVFGNITRAPGIKWKSLSSLLQVVADTGQVIALADTATTPTEVEVTLPADLGGLVKKGTVLLAGSWGIQRTAKLVSGSKTSPGIPNGLNLLILPEGFVDTPDGSDQKRFEDLALDYFTQWRKSPATAPFDTMPLNVYTCWVPSIERGSTVRNLLRYANRAPGKARAMPMETPREPPAANPRVIKKVDELIFQVGLPTPEDATADQQAKTDEWNALYPASHFNSVSAAVFKKWKQRADYVVAFERDTAFGISSGLAPQVMRPDDGRSVNYHPGRTQRREIDKLLNFLVDGAGNPIGGEWLTNPGRAWVSVMMAGGRFAGASQLPPNELIMVSLSDFESSRLVDVPSRQIPKLFAYEPPKKLPLDAFATMTHETGHALGLGDEYGGRNAISASERSRSRRTFANLHDAADITDASGKILVTSISWVLWPRIASAGLVIKNITGVNPTYDVTIRKDPRSVFKAEDVGTGIQGDVVHLRHRPFVGPTGSEPDIRLTYKDVSPAFIVKKVTSVADGTEIRVQKQNSSDPFDPNEWDIKDTILFKPLSTFMSHDKVVFAINASNAPLNRSSGAVCQKDDAVPQLVAAPGVPGLVKGSDPGIVGIYDGGSELYCGMYHPTGSCMMRAFQKDKDVDAARTILNTFCPICRYILVDLIDPTMHAKMNDDYEKIYPKAKP